MENIFFGIFFFITSGTALYFGYIALRYQRGYYWGVSKTGLKSEAIPKWLAYLEGISALVFGTFCLYLSFSLLL